MDESLEILAHHTNFYFYFMDKKKNSWEVLWIVAKGSDRLIKVSNRGPGETGFVFAQLFHTEKVPTIADSADFIKDTDLYKKIHSDG